MLVSVRAGTAYAGSLARQERERDEAGPQPAPAGDVDRRRQPPREGVVASAASGSASTIPVLGERAVAPHGHDQEHREEERPDERA